MLTLGVLRSLVTTGEVDRSVQTAAEQDEPDDKSICKLASLS